MTENDPKRSKSMRETWNEARYDRATKGRPLTRSYTAPGARPGGSPIGVLASSVVLAAILAGLMLLGSLSSTVVVLVVLACLGVGLYMANEQSWVNEEHARRQAESDESR